MSQDSSHFSNHQLSSHQLADVRSIAWEPISKRYLPYALVTQALHWVIPLLAFVLWQRLPFAPFQLPIWVLSLIVLGMGLSMIWAVADARRRRWALREQDVLYRSGVLWHSMVILPVVRIQHVEVSAGPVERWFDLQRIKCFTAGGMMTDLVLIGLQRNDADRVRQHLLSQLR